MEGNKMHKLFRYTMPYCIQKQADGKYVVLNRDYKPIGFNMKEGCTYSEYPISYKLKGLTPEKAKKISRWSEPGLASVYLYSDGTVPTDSKKNWDNYIKRLEVLMRLLVVDKS